MASSMASSLGPMVRRALALMMAITFMGLPLYAFPRSPVDRAAAAPAAPAGPAAATTPATAPRPQELSVEQILDKHYEAIGGDRQRSIGSMRMSGTSLVMGMEAPYTRFSKRPNKVLLEIYVQGMTGKQAFDGENAWSFMPFAGQAAPEVLPVDMALAVLEGSDFDGPLVDTAHKGHAVEMIGVEAVDGRDAYKLRITLATGGVQTHYVDVESFYLTRTESAEGDVVFREHRLIDGLPIPRVMEIMGPMGAQTVYVDEVELNVELDDAMFRMR